MKPKLQALILKDLTCEENGLKSKSARKRHESWERNSHTIRVPAPGAHGSRLVPVRRGHVYMVDGSSVDEKQRESDLACSLSASNSIQ